jgi:hypothetical protein
MSREFGEPSYGFTYPTILQGRSRSYQGGAKHAVTGLANGGIGGLPAGEYPAVKVGQTLLSRHESMAAELAVNGSEITTRIARA